MIKGLSDRRRLPRAGKIRLGITVQAANGKNYPRAVDYFVCPPEVQRVHGERPKELPIMFPADEPMAAFPQELKLYRRSGLFCKGDGERAQRWGEDGELKEVRCPCDFLARGECKPIATLNFLLPDVAGVGVWQINTSSKTSITSLNSGLEAFRNMFGGLAGIPFLLRLTPEEVQRWDEAKRQMVKTTIYTLRLDSPHTLRQIVDWRASHGKAVEVLMPHAESDLVDAMLALPEAPSGTEAETVPGGAVIDAPPSGADAKADETDKEASARFDREVPVVAWDISMCYATAEKLGLDAPEYHDYLVGVYRLDPNDLTAEHVAEQRELLEKALRGDPAAAQQAAAVIRTVARKTTEQKIRPRRPNGSAGQQQTLAHVD